MKKSYELKRQEIFEDLDSLVYTAIVNLEDGDLEYFAERLSAKSDYVYAGLYRVFMQKRDNVETVDEE